MIGARWELIAFAAPLLGVLSSISWQRPVPTIRIHAEPASQRCFEDEQARLTVWATEETGAATASALELTIPAVEGMRLEVNEAESRHAKTVAALAQRWGRYFIRARVDVIARGGLLAGTATVDAAELIVFPLTPPQATPIPRPSCSIVWVRT